MLKDGHNQTDPINPIIMKTKIMKTKASPPKVQSVFISSFQSHSHRYAPSTQL